MKAGVYFSKAYLSPFLSVESLACLSGTWLGIPVKG